MMYKTLVSCVPIWVASRIRCASPPERVRKGRLRVRYSKPIPVRKPIRLRISFSTSLPIIFWRSVIRLSRLSNQFDKSVMSSRANSAIFLWSILMCKASFLSRAPPHSGQVRITIKSLSQSWIFSEPLSCWRFKKWIIPSYLVFHSVPSYFLEGTGTGSSEP